MVVLYLCQKCYSPESGILSLALRFLLAASASSFFCQLLAILAGA